MTLVTGIVELSHIKGIKIGALEAIGLVRTMGPFPGTVLLTKERVRNMEVVTTIAIMFVIDLDILLWNCL